MPGVYEQVVLMNKWLGVTLACVLLGVPHITVAGAPSGPYLRAQTSLGFNPKTKCPDLQIADDGTIATIGFWVPSSGIPSKISIKSSSGSNALDSAAIACVSKLRFAAATQVGDGAPIDSWQQIAFSWANSGNADERRASATEPIAGAPANARQDDFPGHAGSVMVHACVDKTGRLEGDPTIIHSSGVTSLDQAAVRIAASGVADYRPDTSANGPPVSGCVQLVVKFEMN